MTERIREFLRNRRDEGLDIEPCLVVDLDVVRDNYQTFSKALRIAACSTREAIPRRSAVAIGFARLVLRHGDRCRDEMALAAGATPDRISYGTRSRRSATSARAFALGHSPVRGRLRGRGREGRPCRAGCEGVLPHPL